MLESKNIFYQDDLMNNIYKKLGVSDSHADEMKKEVIKHEFANNNHNNQLQYEFNYQTQELQKGQWIQLSQDYKAGLSHYHRKNISNKYSR